MERWFFNVFKLTAPLSNSRPNGVTLMALLLCGSVRFQEIRDLTVRVGAVLKYCESYGGVLGAVIISYGAVRCGSVRF